MGLLCPKPQIQELTPEEIKIKIRAEIIPRGSLTARNSHPSPRLSPKQTQVQKRKERHRVPKQQKTPPGHVRANTV